MTYKDLLNTWGEDLPKIPKIPKKTTEPDSPMENGAAPWNTICTVCGSIPSTDASTVSPPK